VIGDQIYESYFIAVLFIRQNMVGNLSGVYLDCVSLSQSKRDNFEFCKSPDFMRGQVSNALSACDENDICIYCLEREIKH